MLGDLPPWIAERIHIWPARGRRLSTCVLYRAVVSASAVSSLAHKYATLHCWGRARPGQWWALISWHEYGLLPGGINGNVFISAWVPASDLRPSDDPYAARLYRMLERYTCASAVAWWLTRA